MALSESKYYPIGTVVLLNGGQKPILIYGRTQKLEDREELVDYVGVPYPEGHINKENIVFFSHDAIETVLHHGYMTTEEAALNKFLLSEIAKQQQ